MISVFIIIVSVNHLAIKHGKKKHLKLWPLRKHITSFNNLRARGGAVQKGLYTIAKIDFSMEKMNGTWLANTQQASEV